MRASKKPVLSRKRPTLASDTDNKITLAVAGPVEKVVVSATRTETTPEQAAVAATVITEQQLEALNYPMLFDVFRDVPGLRFPPMDRPGALAEVFTRGADIPARWSWWMACR